MMEEPGADSEEKRAPLSDMNTALVDRLKALDPNRPIGEADISLCQFRYWGYSPLVKRKEADRIIGAANTTTGSIVTQEAIHDNSQ
jgi:hypothetical protein